MRKQFLTLALCALTFSSFAKIMIVDNNGNNPQNYTSLQKAIDDSGKGDTLYVKGSNTSYGDATIKKALVLIGDGYAEPNNTRPNSKTTIGYLIFDGEDSGNSTVKGIRLNTLRIQNALFFSNLIIKESSIDIFDSQNVTTVLSLKLINNWMVRVTLPYMYSSLIANNRIDDFATQVHINSTDLVVPGYNQIKNNVINNGLVCEYSMIKNNWCAYSESSYNNWYIDNAPIGPDLKSDLNNNQFQGNIQGNIVNNTLHVYDLSGQVHDEIGIFSGTYAWVDGTQQQPGLMPSVHSLSIDNKYLPTNDTLKVNFKARSIRD